MKMKSLRFTHRTIVDNNSIDFALSYMKNNIRINRDLYIHNDYNLKL